MMDFAVMDREAIREKTLRRDRPYGLNLEPSREAFPAGHPRAVEAMRARWETTVTTLGGTLLQVADVPRTPIRSTFNGHPWELSLMRKDHPLERVPVEVYLRVKACEAWEVPFAWFLWGKELPVVRATPKKIDPMLIGVLPTGEMRGIWCLLGYWYH